MILAEPKAKPLHEIPGTILMDLETQPGARMENMTAKQPSQNNNQSETPWWKLHLKPLGAGIFGIVVLAAGSFYLGGSRTSSSLHPVTPTSTTMSTSASGIRTTSTVSPVGTGYLAAGTSFVDFIQWNDSNGTLSGSAQIITTKGQSPNVVTASNTLPIAGTIHGSTISLSFGNIWTGSLAGGAAIFGTFTGNSLTLNFPQSDGNLAPITFQRATAVVFNDAVAQLQNTLNSENQATSQAQASQAQQNKIDAEANTINSLINGTSYWGGDLQPQENNLASDVTAIAKDLKSETADLATTASAERHVVAEAGQPGVSSGQVCGDAAAVSGDAAAVSGYVSSVVGDLKTLRSSLEGLQNESVQYQSDVANLSGYAPAGGPTQSTITQATNSANGDITVALSTTNAYINQANSAVTTAYGYSTQAFQAGNCGSAATQPPSLTHIS